MGDAVRGIELRVLDGPNLYFPRPAIKLTLAVPGWMRASDHRVTEVATRLGVSGAITPGRARFPAPPAARGADRRAADPASGRRLRRPQARRQGHAGQRRRPDRRRVPVAATRRRGGARRARPPRGMEAILRRSPDRWVAQAGVRLASVDPGDEPTVPDPTIPVIQVTGTNGKTTTVRLLAHLVRASERSVAYSSTDGVYRDDGVLVEAGDYSGFGGAAMALAQQPDVAVLETARGGMLLRGSAGPAQRRGGRHERERRSPRAARRRHRGSARGGQGDRDEDHPPRRMGRPERRRSARARDAAARDRASVALLAPPRPARAP